MVTFLIMSTGRDVQELNTNIFHVASIAQQNNCNLRRLDFQQEQGLMSCLPLAQNLIEIERGLTTSSTAVFIPFTTQELFQDSEEALYYGLKALSSNLIMVDRKKLKNPNGLILGTPGSGKSFAAKREIANAFIVTDDDIIICDPENEYSALVLRLRGEVIRISPSSKQFINPMDISMDYADDDDPIALKVVKNQEMVLEAGTDRVTYRVDTENGIAGSGTAADPAGKETGIIGEAAGQETQVADTAETGENTEVEKEAETDPELTMTVTVSVEDILNYLLPEETEPVQTGTVKDCTMLNIRAGAGTENEVIGHLKTGDQVRVTGSNGKWYQITIPEKDGYVYSKYLDVIELASSDPAVSRDELLQILMFVLENMDKEQQPAGHTPDGNMNLLDDIGPTTGEGQQFVTMTSKNGNYFYLIIDRDDKGSETVHLLNQVDERDLLDLMEDDEAAYYEEQIADQKQQAAAVKAESERLADELKETQAAKDSESTETGGTEADPETPVDPAEKETRKSKIILVVILLAALCGCGYWLVKKMKKNKPAKREVNTRDVDDDAGEELEIPVDDTEE